MSRYDLYPEALRGRLQAALERAYRQATHALDQGAPLAAVVRVARIRYRAAQLQAEQDPNWPKSWEKVASTQAV